MTGPEIRAAREARGFTPEDLAVLAQMSLAQLRRLEASTLAVTGSVLSRLTNALDPSVVAPGAKNTSEVRRARVAHRRRALFAAREKVTSERVTSLLVVGQTVQEPAL